LNLGLNDKGKRYRRSLEIVRDVLLIASGRVRKTRIMYQANLSYRLVEKYLGSLLQSGLVECDNQSLYCVTRRGGGVSSDVRKLR
jgi:predicted transcriptional regulator